MKVSEDARCVAGLVYEQPVETYGPGGKIPYNCLRSIVQETIDDMGAGCEVNPVIIEMEHNDLSRRKREYIIG